jgi:membrane associated rhomboid family serine protease
MAQAIGGEAWEYRGVAESVKIVAGGEWWRAVTALTLHRDLAHWGANFATAGVFAWFLAGRLGGGLAWAAIVASGVIGNGINAAFYGEAGHASIGASTAVFGSIGALIAVQWGARWARGRRSKRWEWIVPLGAGLAFLAFLGAGDPENPWDRTDRLAHLWGFAAGLLVGFPLAWVRRVPRGVNRACAWATPVAVAACWWIAWRAG